MVAILSEPIIEDEHRQEKVAAYQEAIRNGHEYWFIRLLLKNRQFGFEKNEKTHYGMIDFDTMSWLVSEFLNPKDAVWMSENYKTTHDPNGELIGDLNRFKIFLVNKFAENTGRFSVRHTNPVLVEKMQAYEQNFMDVISGPRGNEGGATKEQIEAWIRKIVFGEKPFYKNNVNWSKIADLIDQKITDKDPKEILHKYKYEIEKIELAGSFKEVKKLLLDTNETSETLELLSFIHGGWREETYTELEGHDVQRNIVLENKFETLMNIVRDVEGLSLGALRQSDLSQKEIPGLIQEYISKARKKVEIDPKFDGKFTFTLIIYLGLFLERILDSTLTPELRKNIEEIRNKLLEELKKDANAAPIDALIKYYED